ncbi:hypothetical protein HGRIS_004387 [Hohenbuehelia grisea]|uniref:Fork-head domain-containing protein n=1 Tax=Hohenbuehelia grisea TaxID=104357 RepID=A0ABR3JBS2_9AGAR
MARDHDTHLRQQGSMLGPHSPSTSLRLTTEDSWRHGERSQNPTDYRPHNDTPNEYFIDARPQYSYDPHSFDPAQNRASGSARPTYPYDNSARSHSPQTRPSPSPDPRFRYPYEDLDLDHDPPPRETDTPAFNAASFIRDRFSLTPAFPASQPMQLGPPPFIPRAQFPDASQYLRAQFRIPDNQPVSLWSLPTPPNGGRPDYPLPALVKLAIHGSPYQKLTLQEIYKVLEDRFVWFKIHSKEPAWKNSIRHNLSLNKVFRNTPRPITEPGKGSYWELDVSQGEGNKRERKRKKKPRKNANADGNANADDSDDGSVEGSPSPDPDDMAISAQPRDFDDWRVSSSSSLGGSTSAHAVNTHRMSDPSSSSHQPSTGANEGHDASYGGRKRSNTAGARPSPYPSMTSPRVASSSPVSPVGSFRSRFRVSNETHREGHPSDSGHPMTAVSSSSNPYAHLLSRPKSVQSSGVAVQGSALPHEPPPRPPEEAAPRNSHRRAVFKELIDEGQRPGT